MSIWTRTKDDIRLTYKYHCVPNGSISVRFWSTFSVVLVTRLGSYSVSFEARHLNSIVADRKAQIFSNTHFGNGTMSCQAEFWALLEVKDLFIWQSHKFLGQDSETSIR